MKITPKDREMLTDMETVAREFLTAFRAFSAVRFESRFSETDGDHGVIASVDHTTRLANADGTVSAWDDLSEEEAPIAWQRKIEAALERGETAIPVDSAFVVSAESSGFVDID